MIVQNLRKFKALRYERNEFSFPEHLIKEYENTLEKVCEITKKNPEQLF